MESIANESKSYPASRFVAYTAMAVGGGWTLLVAVGFLWSFLLEPFLGGASTFGRMVGGIAFALSMGPIMSAPGLMCLYYGNRLRKYTYMETVRGAVGALSIMTTFLLSVAMTGALSSVGLKVLGSNPPILFGAAFVMLPLYTLVCRRILIHDGYRQHTYRDIISKRVLFLFTLMLYFFTFDITMRIFSGLNNPSPTREFVWLLAVLGMPAVLSLGFHWIAVRLLGHYSVHSSNSTQLPPII